jgi:hypothetical protein
MSHGLKLDDFITVPTAEASGRVDGGEDTSIQLEEGEIHETTGEKMENDGSGQVAEGVEMDSFSNAMEEALSRPMLDTEDEEEEDLDK